MLHTDVITSIPAVADAHAAFAKASKAKDSLGLVAARRHAEWQAEVAKLKVGTVLPTEPSPVPTEYERDHANAQFIVAREALEAALNENYEALAAAFREKERAALAEVAELAARIDAIADHLADLVHDVIWMERTSQRSVSIEQTLLTDMKDLVVEVARGGSAGRNHPEGTFFQNI